MIEKEFLTGYPIAEGQKFTVSYDTGVTGDILIIYEKYAAGDMKKTDPNGSEPTEYVIINYGTRGAGYVDGDNLLDTSLIPKEFPAFPFGETVPAKTVIEILGICAMDIGKTSATGANKQYSEYLRFVKERKTLFDEDLKGLKLKGIPPTADGTNYGTGLSQLGFYSTQDIRYPYLFETPLVFEAGEELGVYLTTKVAAGSANITSTDICVGLIERIKRV
jgi:hypothetical protein